MSSEIDYRRIGRHFRAARQQLNLKQKDVAELLGVSVKTYSNMERGAAGTEPVQDYPALSATQTETGLCLG